MISVPRSANAPPANDQGPQPTQADLLIAAALHKKLREDKKEGV